MKYVQIGILLCLASITILLGALYLERQAPVEAEKAEVLEIPPAAGPITPVAAEQTVMAPKPEPIRTAAVSLPPKKSPVTVAEIPAKPAVVPPASKLPPPPPVVEAVVPVNPNVVLLEPALSVEKSPLVKPPKTVEPRTVTLPAGLAITVRLNQTLSTERNQAGDDFQAVLDEPLIVDGLVIAEKGAQVDGSVISADRAGRLKGRSFLALELVSLATQDGQLLAIETQSVEQDGPSSQKKDAARIGIGAGIGAAIGAVIGGGKGAGIGAATGAGAGAGTVAATRGEPLVLRPETRLEFRLNRPVTVTEQL